jgi:hypothetical protein
MFMSEKVGLQPSFDNIKGTSNDGTTHSPETRRVKVRNLRTVIRSRTHPPAKKCREDLAGSQLAAVCAGLEEVSDIIACIANKL